ncbi:heparan-alpha-glucosaminide N-acetyltransferase [Pseudochrobactrum kiredjianiae]|uniref:Heparan-alpha-glucosaminide N-acetyltransferase n=1 Tax=Pseudochrobactrum kiredjianiae TaxID=386305 RepID=A0ABW3V3N4_9HYPH
MNPASTALHAETPMKSGLRLGRLDIARGMALIAMAIYHFGWDLEFFGYLAQGSASQGWWRIFARCIASSFLFLVGFSLVLAHSRAIRWRPFLKRLAQVVLAAAAISLLTWFFMPQGFIFFGILHQIALASLLGLLFIRSPVWLTILLAAAIIATPVYYRAEFFNHPALWWVGLSSINPVSNDYVPLFPWFGAVLLGIAAARIMQATGLLRLLQGGIKPPWLEHLLTFIGRHSLIFYLVHQPVLIGLLYGFSAIIPPSPAVQAANFVNQCTTQCSIGSDPQFCRTYCGCMLEVIETNQLTKLLTSKTTTEEERQKLNTFSAQCVAKTQEGQLIPSN